MYLYTPGDVDHTVYVFDWQALEQSLNKGAGKDGKGFATGSCDWSTIYD